MRQTSVQAYNAMAASGALSTLRGKVYKVLYDNGPLSAMEVTKYFDESVTEHAITPRMAELKRMGLVTDTAHKTCSVTGRNVIAWDVTSNMPIPLKKGKTKNQMIEELKDFIISKGLSEEFTSDYGTVLE